MAYKGNEGISRFAAVMDARMRQSASKPLVLDFGSIGGNYELTTNTFPVPIPAADYSICRHVGNLVLEADGGTHGGHEGGDGSHEHVIKVPPVQPGDRVLVAWVQNEPVVIDVILKASSIGG